jgi:chemotaxis protein MotB
VEEIIKERPIPVRVSRPDPFKRLAEKSKTSIDIDSNWLITLSDVLSLLLVFFVMYMVMAKTTVKPANSEMNQNPNVLLSDADVQMTASLSRNKILDEMSSEIKNLDLENDVSVHAVDKEIIITLKEKVTFSPGEAETLISSQPILDNIAQIIQRNPSFLVEIEGHTDNVPIKTLLYPSNWELSVARATSVLKYFISHHGISPSRLTIKGNADQKPVAMNDTPENRARNRRVEIRLKEKES